MNVKKRTATVSPLIERNRMSNAMQTTAEDVADLVEYALNEAEPKLKTKRGIGSSIEVKFGKRKFIVNVARPFRRRTKTRGNGF